MTSRKFAQIPWKWLLLVIGLLFGVLVSLASGAMPLSLEQVFRALLTGQAEGATAAVLFQLRLPRVLLAMLIGAGLAVAGAALQGVFRNPLADPGLIGVSAGAALAAVTVIVLGTGPLTAIFGPFSLAVAAFGGGLVTTYLVYRLAREVQHTAVTTLLLAGIAINALAGAGTGVLTYVADDQQLRNLTFWSMGSVGGATWQTVGVAALLLGVPTLGLWRLSRALNGLLLGEIEALHLGIAVERVKQQILCLVALVVGTAVACSGVIGFVGLVVPHAVRLLFGADHRLVLPASALLGALLLLTADTIARQAVAPAELPIGLLTALLGGPFFLYLLLQRKLGS